MRVFWTLIVSALLLWLLAALEIFHVGPWIHSLLVIGLAFGTTGLLFRPIGS